MTSDRLFIWDDRTVAGPEFDQILAAQRPLFSNHQRIMLRSADNLEVCIALFLARELGGELFLCHSFFDDESARELAATHKADLLLLDGWTTTKQAIVHCDSGVSSSAEGSLHIFTSGTTGTAKIACHRWSSIQHSSGFVDDRLSGRTWLMTYSPTTYAGLQVFFSAVNNSGSIFFPPPDFGATARSLAGHGVEVISATPTYWRLLINSWPPDLPHVALEQATLGGEVIDQSILDLIDKFFQPRGLTHIYASTEAGTAIVTSDRLAGFPVEGLDRTEGVRLRIIDDKLQVKTPAPMAEYVGGKSVLTDDNWLITGDRVEVKHGRVFFVGREDGMINVGGMKVSPDEVETALHSLDEVVDCRVFAKKNPIVGSLVVAEVVTVDGVKLDVRSVKERLRHKLADYKVPQVFLSVPRIEASPHGKKVRQ